MQLLRLLSRVAFICNICFLLASFIQWLPNPPEGGWVSTVIVLGYMLSILVNVVVNCWLIGLLLLKRLRAAGIPLWLLIINFLFFILQLVLFISNQHHP
ncbi:MAG TPA: hypothetical protein VGM30_04875 [Puia sp.]|jgi:hypothetical protein